jgi:hypothetical protein
VTATVRDRPATPEPTPGYLIAAGDLLRDSGIRLRPTVPPAEATRALARAMAACEPDDPHRLLLLAALRKRPRTEKKRDGARPLPERAVRVLVGYAQTPSPGAVAGYLRNHEHERIARQARAVRLAPLIAKDAPRAAAAVADCWQQRGVGLTRGDLRRRMGWRPQDVAAFLEGLEAAGVVTFDRATRTLRPGPRAEGSG